MTAMLNGAIFDDGFTEGLCTSTHTHMGLNAQWLLQVVDLRVTSKSCVGI